MSQEIINRLKNQILAQGTVNQWSGEGFGSAEKNAEDMAKILSGIGISDIKQFGQINKYEPVEVIGYSLNGMRVQNPRPGQYYAEVPMQDGEGGVYYTRRDLSPEEAKQVQPVYGVFLGEDPEGYGPQYRQVDPSTVTTKDGKTVAVTGQTFGNKETGQAVQNTYGERQTGNAWGGTYAGGGNTAYRVDFTPEGTPVFYTTGASSRDDFGDFLLRAGSLALATVPGIGTSIGSAIAPTASTAVQTGIGKAAAQGLLSEAAGGDFLKGAALSGASSVAQGLQPGLSETLGGGVTGSALSQGLTSAAIAKASGGDALQAGLMGAAIGAGSYKPPATGMNSPLTMAQIESGLGTEGYGIGAAAKESGLFDPNMIGSQAYTQTSYPFDMAELAASDAIQLIQQGIGIPAVEQNLIASGIDPLIAADMTQQLSLNPNLTSTELANKLISTYGSNIYDTTIDQINAAGPKSTEPLSPTSPNQVPWDQMGKLLTGLFSMGVAGQIADSLGGTGEGTAGKPVTAYKPADTAPVYDPDYYRRIQQYYNAYLPNLPADVATPLQSWYSTSMAPPEANIPSFVPTAVAQQAASPSFTITEAPSAAGTKNNTITSLFEQLQANPSLEKAIELNQRLMQSKGR